MRRLTLLIALSFALNLAYSQSVTDLERKLDQFLIHLDIQLDEEKKKNWLDLLTVFNNHKIDKDDRAQKLVTFYKAVYDEFGAKEGALERFRLTSEAFSVVDDNLELFAEDQSHKNFTPADQLGSVKKVGRGSEVLILVPPLGYDSQIYDSFMKANADSYTMYAITLPGFGGTSPYSRPKKYRPSQLQWLSQVSTAIQNLIKKENIQKIHLGGILDGFLIAGHFASQNADLVSSLIAFEGQLTSTFKFPKSIGQNISVTQREKLIDKNFPLHLLVQKPAKARIPRYSFSMQAIKNRSYSDAITDQNVNMMAYEVFSSELNIIDLSTQLSTLNIPVLTILSNGDSHGSRNISKTALFQWQKLKLDKPELDVTLKPLDFVGAMAFLDKPLAVNQLIFNFIHNIQENQLSRGFPYLSSPRASLSHLLGTTEININYHRPAARGRKVWGGLVTYGRVWRAGANGATSISFNRDVKINGQLLKSGQYDFFIVPKEDNWTLIFNHLSGQWGSFSYDKTWDALRVDITPKETEHYEEYLKYDLNLTSADTMEVSLSWGNIQGSFEITEHFVPPAIPTEIQAIQWTKILEDPKEDGVSTTLSDAKTMSYYFDTSSDSIWFRFDLYNEPNPNAMALNVLVDTDNDQSTGLNWFGKHNRAYKFEKMISVWLRRDGDGYYGLIGVTDTMGQWTKLYKDNVTHYLDLDNQAYIVGMKRTDIDPDLNKFNLIGAVGEYMTYNDTISNEDYATINLKRKTQ